MVTNDTFELAPWADILVANDAAWWTRHAQRALKFRGVKFCAQPGCCPYRAVMELRDTGNAGDKCGFDPDPGCVRTGGNSGYTATHIVMQGGASRILLCGFDLHGGNWHGPHEAPLRNTSPDTFAVWIERFATLVEPARERGIEILNSTPGSALKCFPMVELEAALAISPEMG